MELGIRLEDIPSKSSVNNWVQKAGHYLYTQEISQDGAWADYCITLDESMVFGQERMLLALAAPAQKEGQKALSFDSVRVLGFAVRASWKWPEVKAFLEEIQEKMGKKALYVVCDGGGNLTKGVFESGLTRVCDVGHEICKLMEQTYKDDERYQTWVKAVAKVRFQVFMKGTGYLLPPKQRTVARFTNLSHVVKWSQRMLKQMPNLSLEEQQTYGWSQVLPNREASAG